jgi:glycosyltransferase involved in cell wall biosynthesis
VGERVGARGSLFQPQPGTDIAAVRSDTQHRGNGVGVTWKSAAIWPLGYSRLSSQLLIALRTLGVRIAYRFVYADSMVCGRFDEPPKTGNRFIDEMKQTPEDPRCPQVVCASPDLFDRNTGQYRIGYALTEVNGIPKEWVQSANLMDEIWVTSVFNQSGFVESGVRRPIFVMPHGVDPERFNLGAPAFRLKDAFVFLSVFEWSERKAPEVLLRAFNRAFRKSDDVVLFCKIMAPPWASFDIPAAVEGLGLSHQGGRIVIDVGTYLRPEELGSLYRSADCFVLPTRGEGWGLPIYEAMACGLPVITTDWSAPAEYLSDKLAYPLRIKGLVPALGGRYPYSGYEWAEPDEDHLCGVLRHVCEHRDEARAKGRRAAEFVASTLTLRHAAERVRDRLAEIQRQLRADASTVNA